MRLLLGALLLQLAAAPVRAGEYWNELPQTGYESPSRSLPAVAHCEALDMMVVMFGVNTDRAVLDDAFVYDFATGTAIATPLPEGTDGFFGANLVRVDAHPDLPGSCRFVLFGGSLVRIANLQQPRFEEVATLPTAWTVDLTQPSGPGSAMLNMTEITPTNSPPSGRFGAGATSRGSDVFMLGGMSPGVSSIATASDLWRLSLNASSPADAPEAAWTQVVDNEVNRYYFSGTLLDSGETWTVYAGQGIDFSVNGVSNVARSTIVTYNLTQLAARTTPLDGGLTTQFIQQDTESREFRIGHLAASVENYMFVFGGLKLEVSRNGNQLRGNNFVTLSRIDASTASMSCPLVPGSATWCAFTAENPGEFNVPVGLQRRDTLVALVRGPGSRDKLLELNMTAVLRGDAKFVDAVTLQNSDEGPLDSATLQALQYSLIAVCIFLFISLVLRFRQRGDPLAHMNLMAVQQKKTGLTPEQVQELPWVKFDADGNHVRVHVARDEEGGETVTELTEEELEAERAAEAERAEKIAAARAERAERERRLREEEEARDDNDDEDDDDDNEGNGRRADDDVETGRSAAAAPVAAVAEVKETEMQTAKAAAAPLDFMGQEQEGEVCSICLLEFEQDELLKRLPCKHLFHDDCIEPWLLKRGDCPLCKLHVLTGRSIEEDRALRRRANHHHRAGAVRSNAVAAEPEAAERDDEEARDEERGRDAPGNVQALPMGSGAAPRARTLSDTPRRPSQRAQVPAPLPASAPARGGLLDMISESFAGWFGGASNESAGPRSRQGSSRAGSRSSAVNREGSLSSDNPMFGNNGP